MRVNQNLSIMVQMACDEGATSRTDMTLLSISSSPVASAGLVGLPTGDSSNDQAGATGATDFKSILAAFQKEAAKTPAERARDAVLKNHGLSEDQYMQLPPKEKDGIDREIVEAVRRATGDRKSTPAVESAGFSASQLGLI